MTRSILSLIGCLIFLTAAGSAQEVTVTGFPLGTGGSVEPDFFEPYYPELQVLADTLAAYPMARAIVTGGADGTRFSAYHDAKNPGVALGRAHALRNLLVEKFGVDSGRIVVQSQDTRASGPRYRSARVRIDWSLVDMTTRLEKAENRPPPEQVATEIRTVETRFTDSFGLQFSAGLSSSPYGIMPLLAGAITWNRVVYVEAVVGHSFWNDTYPVGEADLDTKRRLAGGQMIVFPWRKVPLGIVGGWFRFEEIAQDYHQYVQMSEGPVVGLRFLPLDFASVTAVYNPSWDRTAGIERSEPDNDQFHLSAAVHILFGGGQ